MSAHKIQTSDLDGVLWDKSLGNRYSLSSIPTVIVLQTFYRLHYAAISTFVEEYSFQFSCKHLKPDSTPSPHFLSPWIFQIENKSNKQTALLHLTSIYILQQKRAQLWKECQSLSHTRWQDQIGMQTEFDLHSPFVSLHCMHSCHLIWCAFDENNDFVKIY